ARGDVDIREVVLLRTAARCGRPRAVQRTDIVAVLVAGPGEGSRVRCTARPVAVTEGETGEDRGRPIGAEEDSCVGASLGPIIPIGAGIELTVYLEARGSPERPFLRVCDGRRERACKHQREDAHRRTRGKP